MREPTSSPMSFCTLIHYSFSLSNSLGLINAYSSRWSLLFVHGSPDAWLPLSFAAWNHVTVSHIGQHFPAIGHWPLMSHCMSSAPMCFVAIKHQSHWQSIGIQPSFCHSAGNETAVSILGPISCPLHQKSSKWVQRWWICANSKGSEIAWKKSYKSNHLSFKVYVHI